MGLHPPPVPKLANYLGPGLVNGVGRRPEGAHVRFRERRRLLVSQCSLMNRQAADDQAAATSDPLHVVANVVITRGGTYRQRERVGRQVETIRDLYRPQRDGREDAWISGMHGSLGH